MARHRRRQPILAESRLERWRRRFERTRQAGDGRAPEGREGPFLRRMWQRRRVGIGPVLATLLAGWAVYALLAGDHGLLAIASLEADRDQLHSEIAAIEAQLGAVRERLTDETSDAYLLEKTARESYGLCRPGEVVYRFDERDLGVEPPRETGPLAATGVGSTGR